jgi:hypothetical protein
MKLLLKLKDYCYYEYKGELVFIKNKQPYLERTLKSRLSYLKSKKEIQ